MCPPDFSFPQPQRQRGFALILVLAFVVLLLGVCLAFFSNSILQRQISNSSATQVKVDQLAAGAVNTTISDLKKEIVDGSVNPPTLLSPSPTKGSRYIYSPKKVGAINSYPSVVPALQGVTGSAGLENILKISTDAPFYAGSAYAQSGPVRASTVLSSTLSNNGRAIEAKRWNKPQFVKSTSKDDATPSGVTFPDPKWIYMTDTGTTTTVDDPKIIGRYAYVIYNEGGLLDINVAGYPDSLQGDSAMSRKIGLPYVDLRDLKDSAGGDLLSTGDVTTLMTWRDAATKGLVSSASDKEAAYAQNVFSNATGFLQSGVPLAGGLSDQKFVGRQQMIDFVLNKLDSDGSRNALPYLTTFSRDLNQPSYIPTQSTAPANLGYDSRAPKILPINKGGNNAVGLDAIINPAFLAVRVKNNSSQGRSDGSDMIQGEPLVKKRFALNRLAWLTCKGPSEPRASSSDPDIVALKNNGMSQEWLEQGTTDNIKKYFGLTWDAASGGWKYDQHNGSGSGPSGVIMKLDDIASLSGGSAHEPDFFELLKASIKAGSLAKASTLPPSSGYKILHFIAQYETDSRLDDAIIQIGANIIDQFDTDGYPTIITFNDSTGDREFRGTEDLPYLYRVHPAMVKVKAPSISPQLPAGVDGYYGYEDNIPNLPAGSNITDTGLGAMLLIPELWNPHDWDATTAAKLDQTLGASSPTQFRIYAESIGPVVIKAAYGNQGDQLTDAANSTVSPGYNTRGFPWTGQSQTITSSSAMTFQIDRNATGAQLFREPTVLFRTGHPQGSNLSAPGFQASLGMLGSIASMENGGIMAAVGDKVAPVSPPVEGKGYIGFYLGTTPLIWRNSAADPVHRAQCIVLNKTIFPLGVQFGFYLQYQDAGGTWRTYDEKHVTLGHKGIAYGKIAAPMHHRWAGFLQPTIDGDRHYFVLDPRTSRFGMQTSSMASRTDPNYRLTWSFPPFNKDFPMSDGYSCWLSRDEGIMTSLRDGWGIGANLMAINNDPSPTYQLIPYNFPTAMGFYPGNNGTATPPFWTWNNATYSFRFGLFSQNTPYTLWADRLDGDAEWIGAGAGTYNQTTPQFYTDADGVARRAMGGWTDKPTQGRARPVTSWSGNYAELMGLPMRVAHMFSTSDKMLHKTDIFKKYPPVTPSTSAPLLQAASRPMILNRPFRSVGELGYTFSGTPWKNLNLEMPESGDSALLDVFCINDTADPNALVAGKVDLNTRQLPVLKTLFVGAYKDEWDAATSASSKQLADVLAKRLIARTTGVLPGGVTINGTGVRPLQNISDIVGRWVTPKGAALNPSAASAPPYDPTSFDGFSADLFNPQYFTNANQKTPNTDPTDDPAHPYSIVLDKTVGRQRAAPLRALANEGQTRLWNLMIDVIAQTGRSLKTGFVVEGERRYWVHVAIDRLTGNVVDKQVEAVKE